MNVLKLLPAAMLVFPLAAAASGCEYIGSWLGYDEFGAVSWTSQVHGQSRSHGTTLLEVPGFDFTFGGAFDVANNTGNLKGTWMRTGGHSYRMKGYGMATDASGAAVYVMQLNCNASVVEDCNVLEVTGCEANLYIPNPVTDPVPIWDREPDFGPIPFGTQTGFRVVVD